MTYYALELKGGSRIFTTDQPHRKGSVLLFHRYPDGIYMSLAAGEVEKVVSLDSPPKPEKLAPGQAVFIGSAMEGPNYAAPAAAPAGPQPDVSMDYGYGYYGGYWGGGGYPSPSPPRPPVAPSRIGPNGYPILAPPGSPGSVPQAVGPNGYPILAPQAPAAAPRRRPQ